MKSKIKIGGKLEEEKVGTVDGGDKIATGTEATTEILRKDDIDTYFRENLIELI